VASNRQQHEETWVTVGLVRGLGAGCLQLVRGCHYAPTVRDANDSDLGVRRVNPLEGRSSRLEPWRVRDECEWMWLVVKFIFWAMEGLTCESERNCEPVVLEIPNPPHVELLM
jgi:hypothetical protein